MFTSRRVEASNGLCLIGAAFTDRADATTPDVAKEEDEEGDAHDLGELLDEEEELLLDDEAVGEYAMGRGGLGAQDAVGRALGELMK